jgi:hypothetical protein
MQARKICDAISILDLNGKIHLEVPYTSNIPRMTQLIPIGEVGPNIFANNLKVTIPCLLSSELQM